MSVTPLDSAQEVDWEEEGRKWRESVQALAKQVRSWAEKQGWQVTESQVSLSEECLGHYNLPIVTVELPLGEVILEPRARADLMAAHEVRECRNRLVHSTTGGPLSMTFRDARRALNQFLRWLPDPPD